MRRFHSIGFVTSLFLVSAGSVSLQFAAHAQTCDLALALAVDVSGSVDSDEYRIQMDGLAEALRDGIVAEALVQAHAKLLLVQWTGTSRHQVTIPWVQINDFDDLEALASRISNDPRRWRNFSTAIGEALAHTEEQFAQVADCRRKVIDVSGDGVSNEGISPERVRETLRQAQITVNAVVIDTGDDDLAEYFREHVITGGGAFVEIAHGFEDYPERIRKKLIRETSTQISSINVPRLVDDLASRP